jgi:hypothetical protein
MAAALAALAHVQIAASFRRPRFVNTADAGPADEEEGKVWFAIRSPAAVLLRRDLIELERGARFMKTPRPGVTNCSRS